MLYKILQLRGYDTSTLFVLTSDHGLSDVNKVGFDNQLPEFTLSTVPGATVGELWEYALPITDPDGDTVTVHFDDASIDRGVSWANGILSFTPTESGIPVSTFFDIVIVADLWSWPGKGVIS